MSLAKNLGPKFERRNYEALRREAMAPAIGAAGIAGTQVEQLPLLKKRRKTELQSTLAEGLKPEKVRSVIDTHYEIEMVDGKLVAEDGEPIEEMLDRALDADKKLAEQDEFFVPFLVQQTKYEIDELREWEAMARGETDYNTAVTFSGYREEHDNGSDESHTKLKRAGQKPYWRRGMFRVAHARGGKVHIFNYSIDNCSVELMTEVAKEELDYEFKTQTSTDMLGERIHMQIDDDSWRFIAPRLVARSDRILGQKHGGVWKHGYNPAAGIRRAQAYIESQDQIVNSLLAVDQKLALKHETFDAYEGEFLLNFYDCLALLEKRLEHGRENEPIVDYEVAASGAGNMARAEGKVYDACGMVIGNANQEQHASTGNKTGLESLKRLENKKINCYACKKDVVVDKKYLEKGELYCNECGYHLDVCTGKASFRKHEKRSINQEVSGFEIISNWFKEEEEGRKIKKAAERQAQAELGENATYLDKKRYEKKIRKQLEREAA